MTGSKKEKTINKDAQESETITSAVRISALLKPLENKTDLLSLTLPNTDTTFRTTLLSVDANKLVLDRLTPKDGHDLLIDSRKVTIQISHKGADINFTTTLNESNPEKIMPRYELIFPASIQYLHRRNSYRVTVRNDTETVVEIQTNNNTSFRGELHNISTEGMCIRFPNEIDIPQDEDSTEVHCVVTLPENQELKCTFNICHTYTHKHSKDFRIGGNFQYLDKIQKRAIEKFVVELQRKAQKTTFR